MRALRAALLPASLAVLLWAAWVVPLPVFVERPGQVLSLSEHVTVELDGPTALEGDFLLTVANMRRATTVGVVQALLDRDAGFIGERRLIPPGVDDAAYFARQRDVFAATANVAAAIGLRAAGYPVDPQAVVGEGAAVLRVVPGLPAEGVLEPGDVIVAVDGEPVRTAADLSRAVAGAGEQPLEVSYRRVDEPRESVITPVVRAVAGEPRPVIGVEIQTAQPRIDLPVPVQVDAGRVGGPSAGLLVALTVYDLADREVDLTAGRRIAGTGGLDPTGVVEQVGSIAAKVVAADREGLDLFLLPEGQQETALEALPPGSPLEIMPVATFDEAVELLLGSAGRTAWPDRAGAPLHWRTPVVVIAGRAPVRSRATPHREPGQGRKAAAISGARRAPRGSRTATSVRR